MDFWIFIKNTKKSRNETVDRELEGKAWRSLDTNVLYSIHCTVQYHDGAFKENRVDFSAVDNDIGRSLMIDVSNIEIHGNNCTRAKVTPDPKYCSNMQDKNQFTTKEDKADFSPVVIRANIDGSEIEARFADTDIEGSLMIDVLKIEIYGNNGSQITTKEDKADFSPVVIRTNIDGSLIVDKLRTKVYEIDCMGPHLAPTCTGPERDYSDIPNGSQDVATVEGNSFSLGHREVDTTETGQFLCCSGSRERYGTIPVSGNRDRECSKSGQHVVSRGDTYTVSEGDKSDDFDSYDWVQAQHLIQEHEDDVSLHPRLHPQGVDLSHQSADRDSGPTVHPRLHLQGGDLSRQSAGRDSGPAVHPRLHLRGADLISQRLVWPLSQDETQP